MKLTTAEQMRELDRQAIEERKTSSLELMDRAAEGVAEAALHLLRPGVRGSRAAVLCGSGNNGGDGIAAARLLFLSGVRVRVFLAGSYEKLTPDALAQTGRLSECGVTLEAFDPENANQRNWVLGSQVCVDALLGVGLSRPVDPASPIGRAIALLNETPAPVVAADVPSGISADTGAVLGCAVRARTTVTFTFPKIGLAVGAGAVYAGGVIVRDIGIPADLASGLICPAQTVEGDFLRQALPPRQPDGHKGTFGKLLIVGGAVGYTGAPYLTALAAERTGCGLVSLGVPEAIWPVEAAKCVGAMPFPLADQKGMLHTDALKKLRKKLAECDALALGPGLGRSEQVSELVCTLLREAKQPVVLDADGINALEGHIDSLDVRRDRVTVLTPHDGEFARLAPGALDGGDRVEAARTFARDHGCVLVLKGHRTVTATPWGNVLVNTCGCSALSKGGSGDVLTGVIASLLAQGAAPVRAAALGVWLHGRAGELAARAWTEYGTTPEDVAGCLPEAIREILE